MELTEEDSSNQFKYLPYELIVLILSYLRQADLAKLSEVDVFFKEIIEIAIYSDIKLTSAINKAITALDYRLPYSDFAFAGIKDYNAQCLTLNLLRQHHGIRENLTIIKVQTKNQVTPPLIKDLNKYLKQLEQVLEIGNFSKDSKNIQEEETQVSYLNSCLQNINKNQMIYNPVLLRLYVEVLRISAIINSPSIVSSHLYKKLLLAALLLLALGDNTVYFCLLDLAHKWVTQNKQEELNELKKTFSYKHVDLQKDDNETFVAYLGSMAFEVNGVDLSKVESKQKDSFLKHFNYTLAFFYPNAILKILQNLLNLYQTDGLIYFANIKSDLFQYLINSYHIIFPKIFDSNPRQNLELINDFFDKKQAEAEDILVTFLKQPQLFSVLSLETILKTPRSVVNILKTVKVLDYSTWNLTYANYLDTNIENLNSVKCILQYWPRKAVVKFLSSKNKNLFNTIANCKHKESLLSKLTYEEILSLNNSQVAEYNQSILELLCDADGQLIMKALLENKQVEKIKEKLNNNILLKKLLKTRNSSLLLEKFPKYYHFLRANYLKFDDGLSLLLNLISDKDLFLLVLKLTNGQLSKIEHNQSLIEILHNPVVYNYVIYWQLTYDDIHNNFSLFKLLATQAKASGHIYITAVPPVDLISMFQNDTLSMLLSIRSETLLAWLLFGICTRPQYFKTNIRSGLNLRPSAEIKSIISNHLIPALDKFGYHIHDNLTSDFHHCDSILTAKFNLDQLLKLNSTRYGTKTLLHYICTTNPFIIDTVISHIKTGRGKINFNNFVEFFNRPLWSQLQPSFSWLLFVYFDIKTLLQWQNLKVQDRHLLSLLTDMSMKDIFNLLIYRCKQDQLLDNKPFLQAQKPPIGNVVDQVTFFQLVTVVCSSKFIFSQQACYLLLKKFTAQDIFSLENVVINPISGFSMLDLLACYSQNIANFNNFLITMTDVNEVVDKLSCMPLPKMPESFQKYQIIDVSQGQRKNLKRHGFFDSYLATSKSAKKDNSQLSATGDYGYGH